jgi:hypothetical protein
MDLGTMRKQLKRHEYKKLSDFMSDLELIVSNCKTFNVPESVIYNRAELFENKIKKVTNKYFRTTHRNKNSDNQQA